MGTICPEMKGNGAMVSLSAPAKINLTLEVTGRRSDGYHEMRSILQSIDLCDTISLQIAQGIELVCDAPELVSTENLVVRATRLIQEMTGCPKGVRIELKKHIPLAAGLGGGSSDAAATLLGLNELWGLSLSAEELVEVASRVSSDTAFFVYGGTALVEGRGERVRQLPSLIPVWTIVAMPPSPTMPQKTEHLYASLTMSNFTTGEITRQVAELISEGREIVPSLLFNTFEDVAFKWLFLLLINSVRFCSLISIIIR